MDFLQKLKDNLSASGVEVEIAGEKMIVVQPTQGVYREMIIDAERRAKAELEPEEAALRKKTLSKNERDEMKAIAIQSGVDSSKFETAYDREVFLRRITIFQKLLITEAVRNQDGSKTYSGPLNREEIADYLLATPGVEETVTNALQLSAKKKAAEKAPTSSRKKRSSASKSDA